MALVGLQNVNEHYLTYRCRHYDGGGFEPGLTVVVGGGLNIFECFLVY